MNKKQENIILFDGVCNLCNNSVKFIIQRDPKSIFKFASLQSLKGQKILNNYGLQADDFDSFILINDGKSYLKSTAGLKVLKLLGTPWNVFYIFILIPAPIRDFVYTLVAKTRYKIFGKRENCIIPQPEYADRFME